GDPGGDDHGRQRRAGGPQRYGQHDRGHGHGVGQRADERHRRRRRRRLGGGGARRLRRNLGKPSAGGGGQRHVDAGQVRRTTPGPGRVGDRQLQVPGERRQRHEHHGDVGGDDPGGQRRAGGPQRHGQHDRGYADRLGQRADERHRRGRRRGLGGGGARRLHR